MFAEIAAATIDLIEAPLRGAYAASTRRPFVAGLCGAQGSGKSTVCAGLKRRLEADGLSVAVLSLDDLYLPSEAREELGRTVHPLLRTRGVPGTHDVALDGQVIEACGRPGPAALPRFAKERDTRRPEAEWDRVATPVDILLFEGWCVGARPQAPAALARPVNRLERDEDRDGVWRRYANDALAGDYRRLFARIDWLVLLAAPGFEVVAGWRTEQERRLRATLIARGEDASGTLDDAAIERFIEHYQRITEHVLADMPAYADLVIALDAARRPAIAPGAGQMDEAQRGATG